MITVKAESKKKPAFRCQRCNKIQKRKGACEACGIAEYMVPMFIHYITPAPVISKSVKPIVKPKEQAK